MAQNVLKAGAAYEEITPSNSQFLYGYPYVERMSTGVHDPLNATALGIDLNALISGKAFFPSRRLHEVVPPSG